MTWLIGRISLICLCLIVIISFFLSQNSSPVISLEGPISAPVELSFSEGGLSALPLAAPTLPADKVQLGLALFRDTRLSKDNSVSCNSCHDLNSYGADNRAFSMGINQQRGDANAPSVFNSSYNFRQFWDGRAANLREQAAGPVHNPKEMGSNWDEVVSKLREDHALRERFFAVYRRAPDAEAIVDALVSFEATLVTPNSAFDKYLRGDKAAMSYQQIEGFKKFQNFGCSACHQGSNIGGNMFQTLGIMGDYFKDRGGSFPSDLGRFAVTQNPDDLHLFKVPSLRNVAKTAPYFHDGQVQTLEQSVKLMAKYQLGRALTEDDVHDIVGFLNALTGERPRSLTELRGVANEPSH